MTTFKTLELFGPAAEVEVWLSRSLMVPGYLGPIGTGKDVSRLEYLKLWLSTKEYRSFAINHKIWFQGMKRVQLRFRSNKQFDQFIDAFRAETQGTPILHWCLDV